MTTGLYKKGMVLGIIILFLGAGVLPSISENIEKNNNAKNVKNIGSVSSNLNDFIIFFDDFNDNNKDYDKWTEKSNEGIWEEINQRTEFLLYETTGGNRFEGIESSEFRVLLSSDEPVIVTGKMITEIACSDGQKVGSIHLEVSDGFNFIRATYSRFGLSWFGDSNDQSWTTLNYDKDDGIWNNTIIVHSDRYRVIMDEDESEWIYDTVFSTNPTLTVRIFSDTGRGDPSNYWRSGFDDIMVRGVPVLNVEITYPEEGSIVSNIVNINGTASTIDGIIELVEVQIDDIDVDKWETADGTTSWSYEWDTETVDDGGHTIYARSIDDDQDYSILHSVNVYVDNNPPEVNIIKPRERFLYINNVEVLPFFMTVIIGPIMVQVEVIEDGSGIDKIECYVDGEIKGIGLWNPIRQYWEWYWNEFRCGLCTLEIVVWDNVGNSGHKEIGLFYCNIRGLPSR